jgi:hypothetical protein
MIKKNTLKVWANQKYGTHSLHKYALLFLFTLFFSITSIAQTDTLSNIKNHQIWIDVYPHYFVNEKLEYYGDAGYRSIVSNGTWSRVYARPSFRYHVHRTFELHAGVGFFYIFNKFKYDQFEVTPWQGFQVNWPKLTRIRFKHLFKIEERFSFETNNDWASNFEFRFRYKIFGKVSFVRTNKWYIPFYGEFFVPIKGEIQELYRNKGRVGVGLGYKPDKDWQIAFVFNWQGSRIGIHEDRAVSDYIYQLKIRKVWNGSVIKKNAS